MLYEFIETNRELVLSRTRDLVKARAWPEASSEELSSGIPRFLTQVSQVLRTETGPGTFSDQGIGRAAALHGGDLQAKGFTFSQVVHDYGDVCQSITGLASELQAPISTEEFQTLNRCLDTAIAESVTEFARQRDQGAAGIEAERKGQVTHEIRNLLHSALLAFQVLKTGKVGVGGSTGAVLGRSLLGIRDLVDAAVVGLRLADGQTSRSRVALKVFVAELASTARLLAEAREIDLEVAPVDPALEVEVDVPLLASAITNLLQNAFKYTRARGRVTLRTRAEGGRVLLEVEDECGGLVVEPGRDLFAPARPTGADGRAGLGMGLSICRQAVERNGGQLRHRNLPGQGCIFEIELPAAPPQA